MTIGKSLVTDVCTENGTTIVNGNGTTIVSNGVHCHKAKHTKQVPDFEVEELPSRLAFLTDPANVCTLIGVILSTVSVAFIWQERYNLALTLNLIGNIMDIIDGPIARSMPGRHPALGIVGAKLDTHSDVVSHCVVSACLMMRLSDVNPLVTAVAMIWVMAGVFRQSYFDVSSHLNNRKFLFGVSTDNMPTLVAISMHLLSIVGRSNTVILLTTLTVLMIMGSFSHSLRTLRYGGYSLLGAAVFLASLAASCLVLELMGETGMVTETSWLSFQGFSFILHVLLAYPCYFRYIELNV